MGYLQLCCEQFFRFNNDMDLQTIYDDFILSPDAILEQLTCNPPISGSENTTSPHPHRLKYYFDGNIAVFCPEVDIQSGVDYDDFTTWEPRVNKTLLELVNRDPDNHALCRIDIADRLNVDAVVIRDRNKTQRDSFKLSKRKECRRAFTGDEVVVKYRGATAEVLGIVREYIDDAERQYICIPAYDRFGSVLPLDRNVPRTCTLIRSSELEEVKRSKCLAVYKIQGGLIKFDHYSDISKSVKPLYIVKYIKWRHDNNFPIGIIIKEMLDPIDNFESGHRALNTQFGIQTRYNREDLNETNRIYGHFNVLLHQQLQYRKDLRELLVFTIDSEGAEDLDDAISFEEIENSDEVSDKQRYRIGVHISDVSFFIGKGSCLDKEAQSRGKTLHPEKEEVKEPLIHMIPNKLSTDLFSLLPGKQRLVITHYVDVDEDGQNLEVSNPIRAIIESKKN